MRSWQILKVINKIYEFKDITILSRTDTLEGAIIFQIDTLDDIMFLKVSDYLLKPVQPERLAETIKKLYLKLLKLYVLYSFLKFYN